MADESMAVAGKNRPLSRAIDPDERRTGSGINPRRRLELRARNTANFENVSPLADDTIVN